MTARLATVTVDTLTVLLPDLGLRTAERLAPRLPGAQAVLFHGAGIPAFMSGVLGGFAPGSQTPSPGHCAAWDGCFGITPSAMASARSQCRNAAIPGSSARASGQAIA